MTVTGPPAQIRGVDDIDLSAADFWTRSPAEQEAAFALLRRDRPLPFYTEPELMASFIEVGPGYYAVTRHADVDRASNEPRTFSSARGATSIPDLPAAFLEFFGGMINMDAPRHLRLRKIVSRAFSPRIVQRTEDDIAAIAASVVDRLRAGGPGGDFVERVAAPLPLEVICRMMGVDESRYADVLRCSNVILGIQDPEYQPADGDIASALLGAGAELAAILTELSAARRETPTDDLTSALVHAEVDGEQLVDAEIASFFILLLTAGNETTRNAISHGLVLLSEHPDQRAIWQADPDGVARTAVDEIVRYATPVRWMRRTTTQDVEFGGRQLKAGDKLLLFYSSANRDETVFTDPDRFDVQRSPNPHLGFGGAGPHFCLGAHLARREVTVMWRELFRRVPDIHASTPPQRLASSFINGVKHVEFDFTT